MTLPVDVNVNDAASLLAADAYGPGALVHVESATGPGGPWAEVGTGQTLLAGTDAYTFWDGGGTDATWYRSRVTDATGLARQSGWDGPFRATAPLAYAGVEDLLELLPRVSQDRDRNVLWDCLRRATGVINGRSGRDYFRHPAVSGSEVRTYDLARGSTSVVERLGIVSVDQVEWGYYTGSTYTVLEPAHWRLRPAHPEADYPYWQVQLLGGPMPPILQFFQGQETARVTGAFGLATVPEVIRAGCLALAREMVATILTPGGSPRGDWDNPNGLLPAETYVAVQWGKTLRPPGDWFA